MVSAQTAVREALAMTDFDFDAEDEGEVRWSYTPRPPEQLVAGYQDGCGATHYYGFYCIGTVRQDKERVRVWHVDRNMAQPTQAVLNEIERTLGPVVTSMADARDLDGLVEKPGHPYWSDDC